MIKGTLEQEFNVAHLFSIPYFSYKDKIRYNPLKFETSIPFAYIVQDIFKSLMQYHYRVLVLLPVSVLPQTLFQWNFKFLDQKIVTRIIEWYTETKIYKRRFFCALSCNSFQCTSNPCFSYKDKIRYNAVKFYKSHWDFYAIFDPISLYLVEVFGKVLLDLFSIQQT